MRRVGQRLGNQLAPPVVPLPHQAWILGEGLRSGQIFRLVVLPKTAVPAEGGDAAFGGDAGAGQHRHAGRRRQPIASLFEVRQTYILTVEELLQLLSVY